MILDKGERISQPEWFRLCIDPEFRAFVEDTARAFTTNRELQQDLHQEAFLAIGEAMCNQGLAYYRAAAVRAMERYRKRDQRYFRERRKIIALMKERVLMGEPIYGYPGRPSKKLRFFLKNRGKK